MAPTWAVPGLLYFATEWMFKKSRRVPFYYATYRRLQKKIRKFFPHSGTGEENTCHFEVLVLFSALGMAPTYAVPG